MIWQLKLNAGSQARGAKIYAEFLGGSFTSDAYHMTESRPDGKCQCQCPTYARNSVSVTVTVTTVTVTCSIYARNSVTVTVYMLESVTVYMPESMHSP